MPTDPIFNWIDQQRMDMQALLTAWVNTPSGSYDRDHLADMLQTLKLAFCNCDAEINIIDLEDGHSFNNDGKLVSQAYGSILHVKRHIPKTPKILLVGHMDTVFGHDSAFQHAKMVSDDWMIGPGCADMKGGIVVMLYALLALQRSRFHNDISYDVLITADEEIGSLGSRVHLERFAKQADIGLVYEPALDAQGTLVGHRGGSGNFVLMVHGKAAHAGREIDKGRNAIVALAKGIQQLEKINHQEPGVTLNVGMVHGGKALNQVPDFALVRFNVRVDTKQQISKIEKQLQQIVQNIDAQSGFRAELSGDFTRMPKMMSNPTKKLFKRVRECAEQLSLSLPVKATGGVCDGNTLATQGLATIDTLGVRGGNCHTEEEFIDLNSLTERTKLSYAILADIAKRGLS